MAIRVNHSPSDASITLDEFLYRCDSTIDTDNESSLELLGPSLSALAKNKTFFTDFLNEKLIKILECSEAARATPRHSEQSFTLARRKDYYVRIAIWDAPKTRNGSRAIDDTFYSYGFAHNHNFSLLTTGVVGSGYVSENYSIDIPPQLLTPGSKVELRKEDRQNLTQETVLLYRKWQDIHIQHPSPDYSISLNLLVNDNRIPQYSFDVHRGEVLHHIAGYSYELVELINIIRACSHLHEGNGPRDLNLPKPLEGSYIQNAFMALNTAE